jgi:hypothetical protein
LFNAGVCIASDKSKHWKNILFDTYEDPSEVGSNYLFSMVISKGLDAAMGKIRGWGAQQTSAELPPSALSPSGPGKQQWLG